MPKEHAIPAGETCGQPPGVKGQPAATPPHGSKEASWTLSRCVDRLDDFARIEKDCPDTFWRWRAARVKDSVTQFPNLVCLSGHRPLENPAAGGYDYACRPDARVIDRAAGYYLELDGMSDDVSASGKRRRTQAAASLLPDLQAVHSGLKALWATLRFVAGFQLGLDAHRAGSSVMPTLGVGAAPHRHRRCFLVRPANSTSQPPVFSSLTRNGGVSVLAYLRSFGHRRVNSAA